MEHKSEPDAEPPSERGENSLSRRLGLMAGLGGFLVLRLLPAPAGMEADAWAVAAVIWIMACWWMTQALPLTATAFLPFLLFPPMGVSTAQATAAAYYSPILFLVLGGAMLALAIERTGLHRRLAVGIVSRAGAGPGALIGAFMGATALLSMLVSNTAATLIMMPIALAVLRAGGVRPGVTSGVAGAMVLGIAFSASVGGLGTLVGSPTNAISAGIISRLTEAEVSFLTWSLYGLPIVALTVPTAWVVLSRVMGVAQDRFDTARARAAIGAPGRLTEPERRLLPIVALVMLAWMTAPLLAPWLPADALTDGSIAIAGALALFLVPDGTGRPLLRWSEADRAPWGVIMMFGGGLALAEGISSSGLAAWLGSALEPVAGVPPILIAVLLVLLVIIVTEFASNVASASTMIPVVAGLVLATGADPLALTLPAAFAASWAFMLPSGTGPNAIAWATGHVAMGRLVRAGLLMNLAAPFLIVGCIWAVNRLIG